MVRQKISDSFEASKNYLALKFYDIGAGVVTPPLPPSRPYWLLFNISRSYLKSCNVITLLLLFKNRRGKEGRGGGIELTCLKIAEFFDNFYSDWIFFAETELP